MNSSKPKSNFVKSKTTANLNSSALIPSQENLNKQNCINKNNDEDDAYMSFNNSMNKPTIAVEQSKQAALKSNNFINISNNKMTTSCSDLTNNDLLIKKYELDSSYMDQSILMNKISPSKLILFYLSFAWV